MTTSHTPTATTTSTPIGIVLDVDGDGEVLALTDGLLTLRWAFGFTGPTLTVGAADTDDCTRCDADSIVTYLENQGELIDIDGDGEVLPLTDGLLTLRWLFGFTDGALITGAVDTVFCTRCMAEQIEDYLDSIDGG